MPPTILKPQALRDRDVTDRARYLRRREFLRGGAGLATGALLGGGGALLGACGPGESAQAEAPTGKPLASAPAADAFRTEEALTRKSDALGYNNFYEFGTDKSDPARYAGRLTTHPWSVAIEGEVKKPGVVPLEDILAPHTMEERIYRLRCVEAWSMVIPWIGFPLADLLKRYEPTSKARYIYFETLYRPDEMIGQQSRFGIPWPYTEGLRMDEAMNPLTLLAVGMYGETLPNQNGAPLRLVVPWKYGFKSIKSIVKIRVQAEQPDTTWNLQAPREYGFFANVNPEVDHPRWSQKRERRIGELRKRPTLPFNGYAEQVAHLYQGMDPRTLF